jgi:hypothetical protein
MRSILELHLPDKLAGRDDEEIRKELRAAGGLARSIAQGLGGSQMKRAAVVNTPPAALATAAR